MDFPVQTLPLSRTGICLCRNATENKQHTKAEEELTSKGKIWIGFAAAAVIAFGLFSGQYISIGNEEDLEEDEDL